MKVFLGGTCNGSTWRDSLTPSLCIDYFNPVVSDWNEQAQQEEIRQRQECHFVLYTITPKMLGLYSIAELVDDSNKRPSSTIACFLKEDDSFTFTPFQWKSLFQVASLVERNGVFTFFSLEEVVQHFHDLMFKSKNSL